LRLNTITFALKNLKRKRFRSIILIISIASVVSLLIFVVSFIASLSLAIKKASDRLGADIIVVPFGARGSAEEFLIESKNKSFYMSRDIIRRVKEIKGVEAVTYQTYLETIGGVCCDVFSTQVVAFDQDTDFIIKPWLQKAIGRRLSRGEAIAGYQTYENLQLGLMDVEKTLFNKRFKIKGVLDKTGTGLDNALFMTEEDLEEIIDDGNSPVKKGQTSIIFVKVKKGMDPYYVSLLIEGEIIDVDAVVRSEMGENILKTFDGIKMAFIISTGIVSMLVLFLVGVIFSAIVNERSKEIGIMRAIGAKKADITRLFIFELSYVGLSGSLIGVIVGTLSSVLINQGFTVLRDLPVALTVVDRLVIALLSLIAGVGMCITGSFLPINRIKDVEPLLLIKED